MFSVQEMGLEDAYSVVSFLCVFASLLKGTPSQMIKHRYFIS